MGSKIYVGGLPYSTTDAELSGLFEPHGTVESVRVVTDKFTGKSRGFAFVEMSTDEEAEAAIAALNGTELQGRTLAVSKARPQEPRTGGDRSGRDRGRSGPGRGRPGSGGPGRGRGRW
jgi:RNA recognition motif-containing protein